MAYQIRIRLIVENANHAVLDLDRAQQALKLGAPTTRWKVGDCLDTRSGRLRKTDGMLYRIFEGSCDPILEVDRLIDRLNGSGDAARAVLRENESELSIIIRLYPDHNDAPMETPPFHLSRHLIDRLHELQLEVDVDLYLFSGELDANLT